MPYQMTCKQQKSELFFKNRLDKQGQEIPQMSVLIGSNRRYSA